jgi:DNA-binding NarL/FixJ family response regulator
MMPDAIRVYLVDDHPLVREGLANLINQQHSMQVCGEAEAVPEAIEGIAATRPDVAVIDISLKGASGLDLIKQLKGQQPAVKVVALSMHDESLYAERALRAGALGYVMKRESSKKIVDAIGRVADGKLALSDPMTEALAQKFVAGAPGASKSPIEQLSDRELEVFELLGRGFETRRVAERLNVSIKTVQAYCVRIKQKLGLTTAAELVYEAIRWHERQTEG